MKFSISDLAQKQIKKLVNSPNVFRVGVTSGGCSGFSYLTELSTIKDNDEILDLDGAKVVIDKNSLPFLKGVTLDYIDSIGFSGFKFVNPNASSTCGCGISFNI